jgi:hypothetical protein
LVNWVDMLTGGRVSAAALVTARPAQRLAEVGLYQMPLVPAAVSRSCAKRKRSDGMSQHLRLRGVSRQWTVWKAELRQLQLSAATAI